MKPTNEMIRSAADKNPCAKSTLKELFPEAFKPTDINFCKGDIILGGGNKKGKKYMLCVSSARKASLVTLGEGHLWREHIIVKRHDFIPYEVIKALFYNIDLTQYVHERTGKTIE